MQKELRKQRFDSGKTTVGVSRLKPNQYDLFKRKGESFQKGTPDRQPESVKGRHIEEGQTNGSKTKK